MLVSEPSTSTTEVATYYDVSEPSVQAPSIQEPADNEFGPPTWNGKGNETYSPSDSAVALPDMLDDIDEDDWMRYEPPEALKTAPPGVDSDIVLHIIQDSIERIKRRIAEDEERRGTEVEAAMAKEEGEEGEDSSEKGKQPEIPNISVVSAVEGPVRPSSPNRNPYAYAMSKRTLRIDSRGLLVPAGKTKSKKRSLFALLKGRNHGGEKGETSAAGATRHRHTRSLSSPDLTGRTRSALGAIMKVASRNSNHSPKSSIDEDVIVECVSCLDDFGTRDTIRAPCHHSYCRACFRRLVAAACQHEQQWPPKCCLDAIPEVTILEGLADADADVERRRDEEDRDVEEDDTTEELLRTWRARCAEWSLPAAERVYCGWEHCGLWCRPEDVSAARGEARCPADHETCLICRGRRHEGSQCPQDRDLLRTNELAEEEGWQRCYGCGAYVEHREACQHMTCRCGAEFCYVCGGAWRTCDCTMEQLAAVKRDAEERRFARARRDATEEAELAEALRQVAEFEREEALKAELLRREQQRRARAAHVRREAARRGEVADRFRALRQELAAARVRQRAAVQQDHDAAGQDLERRDEAAREAAERQRAEEQEALREAADAQLAELEARMRAEYAARVAEERRIGAQYAAQLEAYWERRRLRLRQQREKKKQSQLLPGRQKGKGRGGPAGIVDIDIDGNGNGNGNHHEARSDNGNDDDSGDDSETAKAQIHAALAELQRRLDAGFAAWQRRARDALEGCKWAAREEAAIRAELAEEADRRRTGARRAGLAALARRVAAERRWVDAAVAEGARALDAMEQAEVAGRDALSQDDVDAWFLQGGGIAGLDGDADGDGGVGLGFGVGVDMGALGYLGDEEEEDGEEQEEEEVEGDGDGASISRGSGGLTTAMAAETAKSTATATDTVTAATVMSEVAAWEDTWEQVDCHRRHHEDMREFVVPGAFVA